MAEGASFSVPSNLLHAILNEKGEQSCTVTKEDETNFDTIVGNVAVGLSFRQIANSM